MSLVWWRCWCVNKSLRRLKRDGSILKRTKNQGNYRMSLQNYAYKQVEDHIKSPIHITKSHTHIRKHYTHIRKQHTNLLVKPKSQITSHIQQSRKQHSLSYPIVRLKKRQTLKLKLTVKLKYKKQRQMARPSRYACMNHGSHADVVWVTLPMGKHELPLQPVPLAIAIFYKKEDFALFFNSNN